MAIKLPNPQIRRRLHNARAWLRSGPDIVQAGKTPYEVIYQEDIVKLRYYPPLKENSIPMADGTKVPCVDTPHRIPLVIVSPLAVNMLIYDLFEQRSLVRYLRSQGFELYLIDWGRPQRRHNHHRFSTYFGELMPKLLAKVRAHSGSEELSLHGWSFGALFSLCYTALHQDTQIRNLVLLGAPGDYHANGVLGEQYQRISKTLNWVHKKTGWRVYQSPSGLWRSPGWANSLAFKLTSPVNSLKGYWELIRQLDDDAFVSAHATNSAFLDDMVAYPGGIIQDTIHYLWSENCVAHNRLPMKETHSFTPVQSNLLFINGRSDTIVVPQCTQPLQQLVSSQDQRFELVSGGHVGIVSGTKAPQESWPLIVEWLAKRSQ